MLLDGSSMFWKHSWRREVSPSDGSASAAVAFEDINNFRGLHQERTDLTNRIHAVSLFIILLIQLKDLYENFPIQLSQHGVNSNIYLCMMA